MTTSLLGPASAPPASPSALHAIACDLGVFSPTERAEHQHQFEQIVNTLAREVREIEGGIELRFRPEADPDLLPLLHAWMANEHRCCPFFTFELHIPPQNTEGVSLRLLGNEDARAVIRSEIESRGVPVLGPQGDAGTKGSDQARAGSAGLVAGAGALLCVLACSAPMLAVGGAAGSALLTAAGYAETAGTVLAAGGVIAGLALLVRRALRRTGPTSQPGCGAACGCPASATSSTP